jgi:ADP-heptose:LPS heptosyltransferase
MATPALRGLRRDFPKAHIAITAQYPEVFLGNPYVDEVLPAGSHKRVSCDKKIFLTYEKCFPLYRHVANIFCDCAGVGLDEAGPDVFLSASEERWAQDQVQGHGGRVITIQPWPGGWTRNKDWPAERWWQVVHHLTHRMRERYSVVQIGTRDETLIDGALDYRGNTTLREAIALIKYSRLLVACDSFAQQAARAVGTPAVILYGSTGPVGFGYEDHVCISKPVPCGPCYLREPCPYNVECMSLITVEDVIKACEGILGRVKGGAEHVASIQKAVR